MMNPFTSLQPTPATGSARSFLAGITGMSRRLPWGVLLGVWGAGILACSRPSAPRTIAPPGPPPCERVEAPKWPIRVFVQPSSEMNPDEQGKPLDTRVRIIQLAGTSSITGLQLREFWNEPEKVLGSDFVGMEEHTLFIDRPFDVEIQPKATATHLLAVALLRVPIGQSFLQSAPLPLKYGKGFCKEQVEALSNPCFFMWVGQNQVEAGFAPPGQWTRTVTNGSCPSPNQLNARPRRRPPAASGQPAPRRSSSSSAQPNPSYQDARDGARKADRYSKPPKKPRMPSKPRPRFPR